MKPFYYAGTKAEVGLPTSDFRLPTSGFGLMTPHFQRRTSDVVKVRSRRSEVGSPSSALVI